MKRNRNYYIRKTHRYLGLFIGIQFIGWTISGLYFSWTDIDKIHGDQFHREHVMTHSPRNLISPAQLDSTLGISSLELRYINHQPHYWVNDSLLYNAQTGQIKKGITETEAVEIAQNHLVQNLKILKTEWITETDNHHEYRGRPLPAWAVHFDHPEKLVAYIDASNGRFERVRHNSWRWFDFLWMFHTMDYAGRDNFNNWLLRVFSVFGLFTVLSGFTLYAVSSKTFLKTTSKLKKNK